MAKVLPSITKVAGFRCAGVHAGLKKDNALDMTLITSNRDCVAAAVFTKNTFKGAPVIVGQQHLAASKSQMRAVIVNTKSANAATGDAGIQDAREMARLTANLLECQPQQVMPMSTGVIGERLKMDKIAQGIEQAHGGLTSSAWQDAATGIMTTDTHPKLASTKVMTINGEYTIAGIVKGSGMIAPNMATMLSIIVTDAKLRPDVAQHMLQTAADLSYNNIVVDGDTSPNDTVLLLANGASDIAIEKQTDMEQFQQALTQLSAHLARSVVRDGEGVTKFITLDVRHAASTQAARQIAHTIATSPLVKTAFFGNDANWGRIISAAGRSNAGFDPNKCALWITPGKEIFEEDRGLLLFEDGTNAPYEEAAASNIMAEDEIYVTLDCKQGSSDATIWTCDLSHDYVSINADYRT